MRPLTAREARLIAILILLALVALVHLAIVLPIVDGFADRSAEKAQLAARYAANDRLIAAIPRLRRQAEAQASVKDRFVLAAPDAGAGAERLSDRLQAAISQAGGEFRGGEIIAAPQGRVAARVSASLTAAQLAAMIATLENGQPYLIIDSLVVQADDALIVGRASALEVQIEASIPLRLSRAR